MRWIVLSILLFSAPALAQQSVEKIFNGVYGRHTSACTQQTVASTGTNIITVSTHGLYEIYAYVSSTDFTGIAIKCLQGDSTVTVAGVEGTKIPANAHVYWRFGPGYYTISCQTGSETGVYDVCPLE